MTNGSYEESISDNPMRIISEMVLWGRGSEGVMNQCYAVSTIGFGRISKEVG